MRRLDAYNQSRRTNAQARAALVASSLKGFADDKDIQAAFYAIEYEDFKYNLAFHKTEQEKQIDKLLRHFANLALAWKSGLLKIDDIKPVQYYIQRIMKNKEIDKYMVFMAKWSASSQLGQHPYGALSELSNALSSEKQKTF